MTPAKLAKENFTLSRSIKFNRPPEKDFLIVYNELLGKIVADHATDVRYLTSVTLNRQEQLTHLFEKIETYLQLRAHLISGKGLFLEEEHAFLYQRLSAEFGKLVECVSYQERLSKKKFLVRIIKTGTLTFFYFLLGKLFKRPPQKPTVIVRSYFDFRGVNSKGMLHDEYFRGIVDEFAETERVLLVSRILKFKVAFKFLVASKKANYGVCPIESFLGATDIIRVFVRFFRGRIKLEEKVYYKEQDVSFLIQHSLDTEFFELHAFPAYVEQVVAKKLLAMNPKWIVYPFENQIWEKFYPLEKNKNHLETKIVGYQHSGLSLKLLNYFPSKLEKKLPLFPEKIVTVGPLISNLFLAKAHYPSQIVAGPAVRMNIPPKGIKIDPPTLKVNQCVAYAFSYELCKYEPITNALIQVFAESSVKILLKFHPLYREHTVVKKISTNLPSNIKPDYTPWNNLLPVCDLVLYDDNSVGIEAIIHGVKSFFLDIEDPCYNRDRMFGFDLWNTNLGMKELHEIHYQLVHRTFDKSFDTEKAEKYLNSYYLPYIRGESKNTFLN